MDYGDLELCLKKLWGPTFLGTRSKCSQANLDWRTIMAHRPAEERYAMSDEEYCKLEGEENERNKEKYND